MRHDCDSDTRTSWNNPKESEKEIRRTGHLWKN